MKVIESLSMRLGACVSAGILAGVMIGCDMGGGGGLSGIGTTSYKRQIMCPLSDIKTSEAMALGRRVLANHGFRIKTIDVDRMSIETFANEKVVRGGTGRLRESLVKLPNRVRRTASLEFAKRGGDLEAWCQIKMERLSTADHRIWARNREFEDSPTQTPIDGEGATTDKQNTVWTSAGRDEAMERQVMSDVRNRIQLLRKKRQAKQAEESK